MRDQTLTRMQITHPELTQALKNHPTLIGYKNVVQWFKILIHLFPQHFSFYRSLEKTPKCREVSENTDSTASLISKSYPHPTV